MNYLKASMKVRLKLSNPCTILLTSDLIKDEFKIFQSGKHNEISATLVDKYRINYDSYLMTFALPEENKCLGIHHGEYVHIEYQGDQRPYVPISPIDQPDTVDFLVRDMSKTNDSSFTSKLLDLRVCFPLTQVDQKVKIKGPSSKFIYHGMGKFEYPEDKANLLQRTNKTFRNIGIVTHASGITTTYSIIESIARNFDQRTGVSLLWLGDKEEDFVFIDELATLVEQTKLNMNLMLTKPEKGWLGPFGKVTRDHLYEYLPPPGNKHDDTFILMSALEGELVDIKTMVAEMGYKNYFYA